MQMWIIFFESVICNPYYFIFNVYLVVIDQIGAKYLSPVLSCQ